MMWRQHVAALVLAGTALASPGAGAQTFVIYSHLDRRHAERARGLAMAFDQVDIDTLTRPGDRWRQSIAARIMSSKCVVVLWSRNAAASAEVAPEWRIALASGARVVVVLLDDATLPNELAELHLVDWR